MGHKKKGHRNKIKSIKFQVTKDNGCILKLPNIKDEDLPYVSVITPTRNRRFIFELAVYQFQNFMYPKEKLEWVVLDNGTDKIRDMIPDDINLKYLSVPGDKTYGLADLRNHCIKHSSHDYIVYMDDDDYYPPESVLARVKALIKYKSMGVECVGSVSLGCYNILNHDSYFVSNGKNYLAEASICHLKKFWKKRNFKKIDAGAEFKNFLKNRQSKIRDIPFQFVCIALNHHANCTDRGMKKVDENLKLDKLNFAYIFPPKVKEIINRSLESLL